MTMFVIIAALIVTGVLAYMEGETPAAFLAVSTGLALIPLAVVIFRGGNIEGIS